MAFFDLNPGLKLALWARADMVHDTGLPRAARNAGELTIGHNVSSKTDVDAAMAEAIAAGATLLKPAQETFYGGYAGYFQDLDGHVWEIVYNPAFMPAD